MPECRLPLTGAKCVDLIITNLAVFNVDDKQGLTLTALAPGEILDSVRAATEAPFDVRSGGNEYTTDEAT